YPPGTVPAAVQYPGAGAGAGRLLPAAGAFEIPADLLQQPGRVLRDPRGRTQGADRLRPGTDRTGRPAATPGAEQDQRDSASTGQPPVLHPQRHTAARTGPTEDPLHPPPPVDLQADAVGTALFPQRD